MRNNRRNEIFSLKQNKEGKQHGKILVLTLSKHEEKMVDRIIAAIADYIQPEAVQVVPASVLSFPGLEIRQNQHRVFQGEKEINLTRLEYSTLVLLASNPGIVLTQEQILKPSGT